MTRLMLVGNPNCGKTTLFNALTGEHQRVGNWPGVTVEKKIGSFTLDQKTVQITDLPGIYSLSSSQNGSSMDEKITAQAVVGDDVDLIINVIDACQLERHLYLTSQLLECGTPCILALNMMDIAAQRGIQIDTDALSNRLGCVVLSLQAHRGDGIEALKHAICHATQRTPTPLSFAFTERIQGALRAIAQQGVAEGYYTAHRAFYWANRLLEGDTLAMSEASLLTLLPEESDIWMADARYQGVHDIVRSVQTKRSDASEHLTAKIDRVVLHRFWALPIFFGVMYLMFFAAVNLGGALQDFFDISSDAIFIQGSAWLLTSVGAPPSLIALISGGIGRGINTTVTFIPIIASMFFFLALLETSGYMARAAFVVDKAMRAMGLPGKSFVPMIVGFGCNVPAIMAARTLDSERDRLLTVLMSPFMSCSARLAIYAVFVSAFFPTGGHNIVFSLYAMGILMAVFTGLLLRKTVFKGSASPLLLELPAYHKPTLARLMKETAIRLRIFILRAGKLIIPICVVLGGLNSWIVNANGDSVLSVFGQWVTPLFSPMGLHQDNWPATVGLLTGVLAKEVVVGTLQTLYSQIGHLGSSATVAFDFWALMKTALMSIPENFVHLAQSIIHPLSASRVDVTLPSAVSAVLVQHFDGQVGAYAYLLFILLYIPCVSTMAVIRQEAGRSLMWFSIIWSLLLAYSAAVAFYQLATVMAHPVETLAWLVMVSLALGAGFVLMRSRLFQLEVSHVVATS